MFDFAIIKLIDGTEIINPSMKTPFESLTPLQLMEYTEIDNRLFAMERQAKRNKRVGV